MLVNGHDDRAAAHDLVPLVHEELNRLATKYARPSSCVLLSRRQSAPEAASQLGWPTGTVSGRLARGREMLRQRLLHGAESLFPASALALGLTAAKS